VSECRRPIRAHERPHLLNIGRLLRTTREACGLSTAELGLYAELSRIQVWRIEQGQSRTRRSTLRRLAAGLAVANPSLPFGRLLDDLVDAAGPALAEESSYAERKARRRAVRADRAWRQEMCDRIDYAIAYELANERWPDGQLRTAWELKEIQERVGEGLRRSLADAEQTRREIYALVQRGG